MVNYPQDNHLGYIIIIHNKVVHVGYNTHHHSLAQPHLVERNALKYTVFIGS